jgi:putative DNA primase/helicase
MSILASYVEHGMALVSIPPNSKGPISTGWNDRSNAITNVDKASTITCNVGVLHAYSTPLTGAIDIDDLERAISWFTERGINLEKYLNADDAVGISSGRDNRRKLLYTLPKGIDILYTHQVIDPVTKDMILEFRCASTNGKSVQDVLPPSIHPNGNQYSWAGKGSWTAIPTLPNELLTLWKTLSEKPTLLTEKKTSVFDNAPLDILPAITVQHLRSALLHLRSDDRAIWVKAGLALTGLSEVGRGLWLEWSATSEKFNAADASKTWDSFVPENIDYRYVFAEAQRKGWLNPTKNLDVLFAQTPPNSDLFSSPSPKADETSNEDTGPAPQKLPGQLRPVMKLNPSYLPQSIREGVVDIAERLSCPIDYVAIGVLAGAGTILGNSVGILPKEHDDSWVVHAGFWGGIVGTPGSMKTPSLLAALKPLQYLEDQAGTRYKVDYVEYKKAKNVFDKAMDDFSNGKSTDFPIEPVEPVKKRYLVNDVTYQALGEILAKNPQGILALSDELSGLLQSLDTPGQEAARGFFLSGWGGCGSYTFDRISRGSIILNRYQLAVFGGFQPDRIKAYVRFAQSGSAKNDGLLQRFQLLVWPDQPDKYEFIDRVPDKLAVTTMNNAVIKLRDFSNRPIVDTGASINGILLLHFTIDAQQLFNQWYVKNEELLRESAFTTSEHSHFAKYRSLIPGLALLFHLLDGHSGAVCLNCTTSALQFSLYLKSHARRIYGSVHGQDYAPARALAEKLLIGSLTNGFTQRALLHKGWANLSTPSQVQIAVDALVEYGWLFEHLSENVGRKTTLYYINKKISAELL